VAAGLGVASGLVTTARSRVRGANDDVRLGIIGFQGRGRDHIEKFRTLPGVRVVALCDVDRGVLDREVKKFTDRQESVKAYTDLRRLLDDQEIDAIATATPNHWHALITVWACQAGKDVYVEKPVSHNIWEGRQMVKAARKHNRIVQAGTQSRSDQGLRGAFEYIGQGNLGEIQVARALCYRRRTGFGKVKGPQPIPPGVDYDLWMGPALMKPLMRPYLHYDWHWFWDYGNGDIGNQGIHELDMCRLAIGQDQLPRRAMSLGGRFLFDDDAETANTQIAIFDYQPAPIIFELHNLTRKQGDRAMDRLHGVSIGIVIQCEHGYYAGGAEGGSVFDKNGKKIKQFAQQGAENHQANFIGAVRSRKVTDLNADIAAGHLSGCLSHMANISYRLGRQSQSEEWKEAIGTQPHANESLQRFQQHLIANEVDITSTPALLGPWLEIDPATEKFSGEDPDGPARWANEMRSRTYRHPYVIPADV